MKTAAFSILARALRLRRVVELDDEVMPGDWIRRSRPTGRAWWEVWGWRVTPKGRER